MYILKLVVCELPENFSSAFSTLALLLLGTSRVLRQRSMEKVVELQNYDRRIGSMILYLLCA